MNGAKAFREAFRTAAGKVPRLNHLGHDARVAVGDRDEMSDGLI
jgi:hypothetical protein